MLDDKNLVGKTALITGGSRGIGRCTAIALTRQGANIAINYYKSEKEADDALTEAKNFGSRCIKVYGDVSKSEDVANMVNITKSEIGPVDILINNAGIVKLQPFQEISETDWDNMIDVNLKSAFLVTQAVLPEMRAKRWGRIVNMSSVAAQLGGVIGPHYAASKAGLIGLTHSYAAMLAKEGITVNAVSPALIDTDMIRQNPKARADIIPMGRFGTPDEVADVIVMIVCNGYITGQTINVNGGWYMSLALLQPEVHKPSS